jgi:hypothetical protein
MTGRSRALKLVCSLIVAAGAAPGALAQSLCIAPEVEFFSCSVDNGKKQAAVCARHGDSGTLSDSYLQYRFGTPGNLEVVFPKEIVKVGSIGQFAWRRDYEPGNPVVSFWTRFNDGLDEYEITYERRPRVLGRTDDFVTSAAINIVHEGKKPTKMMCNKVSPNALMALDWLHFEN